MEGGKACTVRSIIDLNSIAAQWITLSALQTRPKIMSCSSTSDEFAKQGSICCSFLCGIIVRHDAAVNAYNYEQQPIINDIFNPIPGGGSLRPPSDFSCAIAKRRKIFSSCLVTFPNYSLHFSKKIVVSGQVRSPERVCWTHLRKDCDESPNQRACDVLFGTKHSSWNSAFAYRICPVPQNLVSDNSYLTNS